MALTYDQISAITEKKFVPKLVDNIFDSNPLLKRAKEKFYEKVDGGERIIVPLNYAQTTATGWYSGAETLSTTGSEEITAAEYTWKQLYANIIISGLDERKNSGDAQILNLVKQKTMIAEKTMADQLGTGLYSAGTNAKSIVGLGSIINTSSTVGGISQTSYSWWQGQLDSSTTTLSLSAMQSIFNLASIDNDTPSVCMTTRTIYNLYYALLQPQQRFMDKNSASAGFSSLMFNGIPVIVDSHCVAAGMYFLNEKYLHLFAHKDVDFAFEPFQKPVNQDVKMAKVLWMGALGSSNNRMHGRLSGITA
jgi:hypothetical protein